MEKKAARENYVVSCFFVFGLFLNDVACLE